MIKYDLNNRVAVVTGGAQGFGLAITEKFIEAGAKVVIWDIDENAAKEAIDKLKSEHLSHQIVDVTNFEIVNKNLEEVEKKYGKIDIFVNNAGIVGPRCRFESLPIGELANVLAVNVTGLAQCTQEALKRMSTRHGGTGGAIVNVSSGAAHRGNPGGAVHYAVSKGAVNSLTIGLSQELAGEGIRVNTVSPGLTATDMPDAAVLESAGPTIPMGRVGEADEIAAAIVWLLSDQASYVAGANIRVAGGRP